MMDLDIVTVSPSTQQQSALDGSGSNGQVMILYSDYSNNGAITATMGEVGYL